MCSPLWSVYSRRVSTYPGSRSMVLLLVSRRFRLFILCLIAPLVINHLTPELTTTSSSTIPPYQPFMTCAYVSSALAVILPFPYCNPSVRA